MCRVHPLQLSSSHQTDACFFCIALRLPHNVTPMNVTEYITGNAFHWKINTHSHLFSCESQGSWTVRLLLVKCSAQMCLQGTCQQDLDKLKSEAKLDDLITFKLNRPCSIRYQRTFRTPCSQLNFDALIKSLTLPDVNITVTENAFLHYNK